MLTDGTGDAQSNPDFGKVTDRYVYDAYGNTLSHTGATDQPYQYVGRLGYYTHHQDPEFGLMQLGVRFYDARIGRFSQRDPITSLYSNYLYADARPYTHVDPTGEVSMCSITTAKLHGYCNIYRGSTYVRTKKINGLKTWDTCGDKRRCKVSHWYVVGECSVSGAGVLPAGMAIFSCGFNLKNFDIGIPGLENYKVIKFPWALKLRPGESAECKVTSEMWIAVYITY